MQERYEWVIAVSEANFETFRAFDGTAKGAGWAPIRMRLVNTDERGRSLRAADIPWLGQHAPVLKAKACEAVATVLLGDGELTTSSRQLGQQDWMGLVSDCSGKDRRQSPEGLKAALEA